MENQIETLVASAPIKCSADKFYNFFKYNMNDIVKIFPATYEGVELLEGEEGTEGCVKLWRYVIGGVSMTAKVKIETIDDAEKSITFVVLEGDVLLLYKNFKATFAVSEGLATWTIAFEKSTIITPPPELYIPVVIMLCSLVDAYLLVN